VVAQKVAGLELEVLEVERGLARLRCGVCLREAVEQCLEQVAVVRGELVERGLLDRLPRLLVGGRALAPGAVRREVEQPLGQRFARDQLEHASRVGARELGRVGVVGEAARGDAELLDPVGERPALAQLEHERPAGRAQRLVDADQHPAQAFGPIRREQPQPLGLCTRAEAVERLVERLAADHGRLGLVQLAEAWIQPRLERIGLEQPVAEAVDGRDPGAVQRPSELEPAPLAQCLANPRAQLRGRAFGVRDHEHGVHVEALVADRGREALDQNAGLSRPGARGQEDVAARLDRHVLFRIRDSGHARLTRHIRQRSHHAGHSPPLGSCLTSPARIRSASSSALSFAPST
jgi:hypothetical protein